MKTKHWMTCIGIALLLHACGGSPKDQSSSDNNTTVSTTVSNEDASLLDSISTTVNEAKETINQTTKELDALLDEL